MRNCHRRRCRRNEKRCHSSGRCTGGPRSPRRFRLLALLLAAFALLSAVWYFTAYRPYDVYMEALRAPGGREAPALPGCGTDGEGYNCNVARPGFLHWTGNLGIGMPNLTLENGEEVGFTDSLLIWPRMTGEPELGVLLFEYDFQEDGVTCAGHQLYITAAGEYRPYGDAAEDAANAQLLAEHQENVETLLSRARRSGACRDSQAMEQKPGGPPGSPGGPLLNRTASYSHSHRTDR